MSKIEQDIRKIYELQKQYEDYKAKYEDDIYERLSEYIKLTGFIGNDFGIDSWEFNGDKIDIVFTQYGSYSFHETDSRSMPIEYLWVENWLEDTKAIIERKKEEDRIAKERQTARNKAAQEKRDRAKFDELKKRFGDK